MNAFHDNVILRMFSSSISLLLIVSLLLYAVPVQAQVHAAPPKGLRIMILSGEGALNNVEARTAREPIVQVQDENHKPVAGAAVLFTIHGGKNGAGGSFKNNSSTYSAITNANGIAVGTGFQPNSTSGAWQVSVTASYGSLTASTVINENNILPQAPQQQINTQFPTNTITPGTSLTGGPHLASGLGHGVFHPFHWFLTQPGILVGAAVVVASVITVVVVTQPKSPTQILTGTTSVGAPAVQPSPGLSIHFGGH